MRKKKMRGAAFAEGTRVWSLAARDAAENGNRLPAGVVLRATKKADGWWYTVQLIESDRIVSRHEESLMAAEEDEV